MSGLLLLLLLLLLFSYPHDLHNELSVSFTYVTFIWKMFRSDTFLASYGDMPAMNR
jgi:hypothetical protein